MKKRKLTDEQKKANKRASDKRYREANREIIKKKAKAHREANREKDLARHKAYREANKESLKEYRYANRLRFKAYNKAYREANTFKDLFIVYCLPNNEIPYVGQTSRPKLRMAQHSSVRDTSEWFILQVCKTRKEALRIEREYHEKGYGGANEHHYKKVA